MAAWLAAKDPYYLLLVDEVRSLQIDYQQNQLPWQVIGIGHP
jgi:hypothetical protein